MAAGDDLKFIESIKLGEKSDVFGDDKMLFDKDVTEESKAAVANSCLFAQLAVSGNYGGVKENPLAWFKGYCDVLNHLGWEGEMAENDTTVYKDFVETLNAIRQFNNELFSFGKNANYFESINATFNDRLEKETNTLRNTRFFLDEVTQTKCDYPSPVLSLYVIDVSEPPTERHPFNLRMGKAKLTLKKEQYVVMSEIVTQKLEENGIESMKVKKKTTTDKVIQAVDQTWNLVKSLFPK